MVASDIGGFLRRDEDVRPGMEWRYPASMARWRVLSAGENKDAW